MRTVLILLLLANLTLLAFTRLDRSGGGEPARLADQLQPEKIRILSAQEVAALGPGKLAALPDVCLEWGPLADTERTKAMNELAPLNLGALVASKRLDAEGGFSPTVGPFASRALAERRVAEIRGRGVDDVGVVEARGQFVVSLGLYRTEQAAAARAEALTQQGVAGIRVGPRPQAAPVSAIVVRDPPAAAVARVKELQGSYPGSEVRVGGCDKTA